LPILGQINASGDSGGARVLSRGKRELGPKGKCGQIKNGSRGDGQRTTAWGNGNG